MRKRLMQSPASTKSKNNRTELQQRLVLKEGPIELENSSVHPLYSCGHN
jgi:hypothetical protein